MSKYGTRYISIGIIQCIWKHFIGDSLARDKTVFRKFLVSV